MKLSLNKILPKIKLMFLWDTNIFTDFEKGNSILQLYLNKIPWTEIALPSVVVAEILRGRYKYALTATPEKLPLAHKILAETRETLDKFNIAVFDERCAQKLEELKRKHKTHKRYPDMMIATMALAGEHIVVTRNQKHFQIFLPKTQLANWIDKRP